MMENKLDGRLEVQDALSRSRCLCHLDGVCIPDLIEVPWSVHGGFIKDGTSSGHGRMGTEWREVLLQLGFITSIAERDYCATLREMHKLLADKNTLKQVGSLLGCPDQLVAYGASKCLRALLLTLVDESEALVRGCLQHLLKAIQDVDIQEVTAPVSVSDVNRAVFTFDTLTALLQSPRTEVKGQRLPCLDSVKPGQGDGEHTSETPEKSATDLAGISCTSSQKVICKLNIVFAAHLVPNESYPNVDDILSNKFLSWLQSLDNLSSRKVCYSFFRLLYALTKYLFHHGQDADLVSHALLIAPQLASLVRCHCQGNISILKVILDTLDLLVQYRLKEVNPPYDQRNQKPGDMTKTGVVLSEVFQKLALDVVETTWLESVPYHRGPVGFGGTRFEGSGETRGSGESVKGDRALLRKLAILIIHCLEYVSSSSEHPCSLLSQCVQKLSIFFASNMNILPASPNPNIEPSEWIFPLFCEQDDALIGAMLSLLKTSVALHTARRQRNCTAAEVKNATHESSSGQVENCREGDTRKLETHRTAMENTEMDVLVDDLSPHCIFLSFLHHTTWDHSILLDHLISVETDFLEYLVRYLRYATSDWQGFVGVHKHQGKSCLGVVSSGDKICLGTNLSKYDSDNSRNDTYSSGSDRYASDVSNLSVSGSDDDDGDSGSDDDDGDSDRIDNVGNDTDDGVCSSNDADDGGSSKCALQDQECVCEGNTEVIIDSSTCSHKRKCYDPSEQDAKNKKKIPKSSCAVDIQRDDKPLSMEQHVHIHGAIPEKYWSVETNAESLTEAGGQSLSSQLSQSSDVSSVDIEKGTNDDAGSCLRSNPALLDDTMTVLIRLRLAIERLDNKNLFPFSAKPLIRLLMRMEELYEN